MKMNKVLMQFLRPNFTNHITKFGTGRQQLWRVYSNATSSNQFNKEILDKLVRTNKVVIFMKGNPQQPMCGFSNAVVQILRMHGVEYDSHDVLKSEELRQSIKDYSEWPTIPQVYINGEFLGGCDIILQMHQSGDLIEKLQEVGIESLLLKDTQTKEVENKEKK